jgi:hypothetical protein
MRDFLQGLSFSLWSDSGAPKLLIPLANLVDLQLRGSGIHWSALVWPQWVWAYTKERNSLIENPSKICKAQPRCKLKKKKKPEFLSQKK